MKVLFLGTSGVHYPLVAANLFAGRCSYHDLRMIRGFCDSYYDKNGGPIFVAEDPRGNQVYSLGMGREVDVGRKAIEDLRDLLGFSSRDLAVKIISRPGDRLVYYLNKIPKFLGGSYLNFFISNYIISRNLERIKQDVEEFKAEIMATPGDGATVQV